jgi:acetaldehyde/propanal dehydrogenase
MNDKRRFLRTTLAGLATATLALAGGSAPAAEAYPSKPIKLIVPFPPGGPTDIMGRIVARLIGDKLKQTVVVENKPGAGGNLGTDAVAKSPSDGYTLALTAVSALAIAPALQPRLPYNVNTDLTPIVRVGLTKGAIVAHPSVPFNDLKGMVAYAKANPGKLAYGSSGVGTANHLAGEMLAAVAGIELIALQGHRTAGAGPAGRAAADVHRELAVQRRAQRQGRSPQGHRRHLGHTFAAAAQRAHGGRAGLPRLRRRDLVRSGGPRQAAGGRGRRAEPGRRRGPEDGRRGRALREDRRRASTRHARRIPRLHPCRAATLGQGRARRQGFAGLKETNMQRKIKCALIGPGNIGTDLLAKLQRSPVLEPVWMVGIDPASDGLQRAREMGIKTTAEGVDGLLPHVLADGVQIAFDATSAYVHAENSRKLNELGVMMIDLTPAAIGPYCVPPVNLMEHVGRREMNVNMVTCGGQATIPMVYAVSRVQPVEYGEIVATVSSRSVGPGTRKNIDEFTRTTAGAVQKVGGAKRGKAIIVINPAEPPLMMRDTIHCLTVDTPKAAEIEASVHAMMKEVQKYVPGYRLVNGPVIDGNRVSIYMEVEGLGDYLPRYAGNLDIMTAAAARTAEMFAEQMLAGKLVLEPVSYA